VAKPVDAADFDSYLECALSGNWRCRTAQIRGTPKGRNQANPEPSLLKEEGVETRRAAPKAFEEGHGEGIVQTTNAGASAAAAEAEVVRKSASSKGSVGSSPAVRTISI